MKETRRLAAEVARAVLNAELEYVRWTREYSTLDMGCENLLSTSVARAASAFYGVSGNVTVFLEKPIRDIAEDSEWKSAPFGGRIDCAIYKGDSPFAIVECKRKFAVSRFQKDAQRCVDLLNQTPSTLKCALLAGLRGINVGDKHNRAEIVQSIRDDLRAKHPDFRIEATTVLQELPMPVPYDDNGIERVWTAALAGCLTIERK